MKKVLSIILVVLFVLFTFVGCNSNNADNNTNDKKEETIWLSDHVECIVDVHCAEIRESGYLSNKLYESSGTIEIDIKKFSNDNLVFNYVSVKLEIHLWDQYGAWKFKDTNDVKQDNIIGQKMTKIISLSSGGSATFSTKIYLSYNSKALISIKDNLIKPDVRAYIYKEAGTITKR